MQRCWNILNQKYSFKNYVIIMRIPLDSTLNQPDFRLIISTSRNNGRSNEVKSHYVFSRTIFLNFFFLSTIPPSILGFFFVSWLQTRVPPCCQRPYKHFAWLFHERGEASIISAGWTDFSNLESFLSRGALEIPLICLLSSLSCRYILLWYLARYLNLLINSIISVISNIRVKFVY